MDILYAKLPPCAVAGATVEVLFELRLLNGKIAGDVEKSDLVEIRWFRGNPGGGSPFELVQSGSRSYVTKDSDVGLLLKVSVALRSSPSIVKEALIDQVLPTPARCAPRPLVSSRNFYRTMHIPGLSVRVVSYNILSPTYATEQQYPYAKPWVLDIGFRRSLVLEHLAWLDADVVCLQEVSRTQYVHFFLPEMIKRGYDGLYKQKTTDNATGLDAQLDGCAVFYRTTKFSLVKVQDIEFYNLARQTLQMAGEQRDTLIRFSKHNVGQLVMLAVINPPVVAPSQALPSAGAGGYATGPVAGMVSSQSTNQLFPSPSPSPVPALGHSHSVPSFDSQPSTGSAGSAGSGPVFQSASPPPKSSSAVGAAAAAAVAAAAASAGLPMVAKPPLQPSQQSNSGPSPFHPSTRGAAAPGGGVGSVPRRDLLFGRGPAHNRFLCVANLHVVSDSKLHDVKLFQVHSLTGAIPAFVVESGGSLGLPMDHHHPHMHLSPAPKPADTAVVLCGDFNSPPDSAVYEYITAGMVSQEHLKEVDVTGALAAMGHLWHGLELESAYPSALHAEPSFTNYTENFVGCLDYIFVSQRARVAAALGPPCPEELAEEVALPSSQHPSDHIPVAADIFV